MPQGVERGADAGSVEVLAAEAGILDEREAGFVPTASLGFGNDRGPLGIEPCPAVGLLVGAAPEVGNEPTAKGSPPAWTLRHVPTPAGISIERLPRHARR
jgi:hypothetical protein